MPELIVSKMFEDKNQELEKRGDVVFGGS